MNRTEHRAIYPGGCAPPVLAKSEPEAGSSGADDPFHSDGVAQP
jgi:hypothetical protein